MNVVPPTSDWKIIRICLRWSFLLHCVHNFLLKVFHFSESFYLCSAAWLPGSAEVSERLTTTQQRRVKDPEICLPYVFSFSSLKEKKRKEKDKEVAISLFLWSYFNEAFLCVFIYLTITQFSREKFGLAHMVLFCEMMSSIHF